MIIDSGSRDGPLGPVLSSTFAIQPCAHRGQNLGHIPYQVIVNLGRVHHDQLPTLSGQRSVDILRTEPAEPIPMLNHNPRDRQIAQHRRELTSVPVEHRPDLGDNLVDRDLFGCGPRSHPRHLPIQIRLLISRRHPRVHRSLWLRASLASQLVDQNESTNLPGRDRQEPSVELAIRGHPRDAIALGPRREIHTSVPTARHRQLPTTHRATVGSPGSTRHRVATVAEAFHATVPWRGSRPNMAH